MRIAHAALLAALVSLPAMADFSYTTTQKSTGGMMASMVAANAPTVTRTAFKGQKMKVETSANTIIMDFDAETVTMINNAQKSFTVRKFSDTVPQTASNLSATIDAKETGQHRNINGFDATEWVMTMQVDPPAQAAQMGKMQVEMDLWVSSQVPGAQEVRAFYQRNAGKTPWAAMAGGRGNPGLASAMADLQKKLSTMNGVAVEQIIKMKSAGGGQMPAGPSAAQMAQMQGGMAKACAQMAPMLAQGGPAAAMIRQQYDRMGCGGGSAASPAAGGSSGSLIEMTMDSSDFSTASIPGSAFDIPDGYQKTN